MDIKGKIQTTMITGYSKNADCYISRSPLYPDIIGVGDTREIAEKRFMETLKNPPPDIDPELFPRSTVLLSVSVQPETRRWLAWRAKERGITQGEYIDYILTAHDSSFLDC